MQREDYEIYVKDFKKKLEIMKSVKAFFIQIKWFLLCNIILFLC